MEIYIKPLHRPKVLVHQGVDEKKGSTRKKDSYTEDAIKQCDAALVTLPDVDKYNQLMGLEGTVAKTYFSAYYQSKLERKTSKNEK